MNLDDRQFLTREALLHSWARIGFLFVAIIVLTSCATAEVHDMTFVAAKVVNAYPSIDLQASPEVRSSSSTSSSLLLLRLSISSNTDLNGVAAKHGLNLAGVATFCKRHNAKLVRLGESYVFLNNYAVGSNRHAYQSGPPGKGQLNIYQVYIGLKGDEVKEGSLPSPAFDLVHHPDDICLTIEGGAPFHSFASNIVDIPHGAISQAITNAGMSVGPK